MRRQRMNFHHDKMIKEMTSRRLALKFPPQMSVIVISFM